LIASRLGRHLLKSGQQPDAPAHTVPPCTCLRCSTANKPPQEQRTWFVTPRCHVVRETRIWRYFYSALDRHPTVETNRGEVDWL
jgi:hypothetical protein